MIVIQLELTGQGPALDIFVCFFVCFFFSSVRTSMLIQGRLERTETNQMYFKWELPWTHGNQPDTFSMGQRVNSHFFFWNKETCLKSLANYGAQDKVILPVTKFPLKLTSPHLKFNTSKLQIVELVTKNSESLL